MPRPPTGRRVVITGFGCVSPLGATADETWNAAIAGQSGAGANQRFDTAKFSVKIAAQTPDDFDLGDLPAKEMRRLDRFALLALAAAREALRDAGLDSSNMQSERCGVAIGSGIGGLETLSNSIAALKEFGPRRVSPFTIPMSICNMASGYVAIRHGLRGPNLCQTAACASGAHSIGEAARAIERAGRRTTRRSFPAPATTGGVSRARRVLFRPRLLPPRRLERELHSLANYLNPQTFH